MSDVALLKGVEARLRAVLADPDGKRVGIQLGCQPPPVAKGWYVAIDDAGWRQTDDLPESLDEVYAVRVVVTWWLAVAPADRRAAKTLAAQELRDVARTVWLALHGSYDVLAAANAVIGTGANGFVEPLRAKTAGGITPKGADWVWAEESSHPPTVFVRELLFADARRVQGISGAT